jgi:hypothetical protein
MTFERLLSELSKHSVKLRRDGDSLLYRGMKDALDSTLLEELREHKQSVFKWLGSETGTWVTPRVAITPEQLPLVDLTQADIERIVQTVPGGAVNIQDIYPLAPLQEGILFHHLMAQQGDTYQLPWVLAFDTKQRLEGFVEALQMVINRHDILRTAVLWEELPEPVQVVWRSAAVPVEEVVLNGGHAADALLNHIDPRRHRIDVRQAPMMRAYTAEDKKENRWLLGLLSHHLAIDYTSLKLIVKEVRAYQSGRQDRLPRPFLYRDFVAQARLGVSRSEHEAFFSQMLGSVDEPTAPFGLMDVRQADAGAPARWALALPACAILPGPRSWPG